MVGKRTLITWWWLLVLQFYCYGSVSKSHPTYCDSMNCSMSGFLVLHHLLAFVQTHIHWNGDAIQPSYPLSSPSPPAFNLSMRVFSNELALHIRWLKYWRFSISASSEYSGLISFRINWFDLLDVQETLKCIIQHHNSKTSVLWHSGFFIVQLSHWSEKAMATHSSTLAWKIPWTEEPGRLQTMGSRRVEHDWATSLSFFTFLHWRRKWQPTPVFLPGESQGRGSLVGCRLWGRTESDTTEAA